MRDLYLSSPNPNLGLKAYCVEEGQIQEGPEGWDGMEVQKLCNTERVSSLSSSSFSGSDVIMNCRYDPLETMGCVFVALEHVACMTR